MKTKPKEISVCLGFKVDRYEKVTSAINAIKLLFPGVKVTTQTSQYEDRHGRRRRRR